MQLARCVWRKRRFLFTRLTMVLAKGSRFTFFSNFVPGSVSRTRSQIVNPSIHLSDIISSVFQVYKNHWVGQLCELAPSTCCVKKCFNFFFFVCVYVRRLKALFFCACLRAKVEGLKGVVAVSNEKTLPPPRAIDILFLKTTLHKGAIAFFNSSPHQETLCVNPIRSLG